MLRRVDDELEMRQYAVPDYILISEAIELAAALLVLVTCLVLVRRGAPAVLGAVGALLAGVSIGVATAETLAALYRDAGPWQLPEWVWQLVNYGRAAGLALIGLAVLVALARTGRPAPLQAESA